MNGILRRVFFLALLGAASACCPSPAVSTPDAGARSEPDSGPTDAGARNDGGAMRDGGLPVDGGPPDAGLCGQGCGGGGACIAGSCCPAVQACGAVCCDASDVCLFDACVTPGAPCTSNGNCPEGDYCEPSLGGGDGGASPAPAPGCVEPPPAIGRCLPLPCDGGSCGSACQVIPPLQLPLHPVVKWSWGPNAREYPDSIDVWSTPTVGRLYDANCDGVIDDLDPPDVVFVSGNAFRTCCSCGPPDSCTTGVLRMLNGRTGEEIWSLPSVRPDAGFLGFSIALGDIDGVGRMQIVAVTGDGYVVLIRGDGTLERTSDQPIVWNKWNGWGGGLAVADLGGTGHPNIIYGSQVFSTEDGGITLEWSGGTGGCLENRCAATDAGTYTTGMGGGIGQALSIVADLDGKGPDVIGGNTAYRADGGVLWYRADLPDGYNAVADLNGDGVPDVVLVANGQVWVLDGPTGATELGPFTLPGTGGGGPPTIASFDGDGGRQIGVAQATYYSVLTPDYDAGTLDLLWKMPNHDFSSAITGSTVFDFEGQGRPSVIYGDECFLWVFDGPTGAIRFATPHDSFTATESSMVADVDGDGRAEILMVSNGAVGWGCNVAPWNQPDPDAGRPAWTFAPDGGRYRGITAFGDSANGWVGTRTLWNEHAYHVTNICDDTDDACAPPDVYGSIPAVERSSWTVPWLDDYRQNVQQKGLFNAPDPQVDLHVACDPVTFIVDVRNVGAASLPAAVPVAVFTREADGGLETVGSGATSAPLLPGQFERLTIPLSAAASSSATFVATIENSPPRFHSCRTDDETSAPVQAHCNWH